MDISLRDAVNADVSCLMAFDPVARRGVGSRAAWIRERIPSASVRVAECAGALVGYCAMEASFFGQSFVELLVVAERARRRGVGSRLLRDAEARCPTPKLFTSTNLSNLPMQSLLRKLDWRSAGIVYGLDEGDPELIFQARGATGRGLSS